MAFFGVTITDDRARTVPALAVRRAAREARLGGAVDASMAELRKQLDLVERRNNDQMDLKHLGTGCLVYAAFWVLIAGLSTLVASAQPLVGPLRSVVPLVAVVYWYRWRYRSLLASKTSEIALGLLMCPSCGYSLRGLSIASDRCVECPECRAAWASYRMGLDRDASFVEAVGAEAGRTPTTPLAWLRSRFVIDARGRLVPVADYGLVNTADRLVGRDASVRVELARQWIQPSPHEVFWSRVGLSLLALVALSLAAYIAWSQFIATRSAVTTSANTSVLSLVVAGCAVLSMIVMAWLTLARGWRYIRVPDSELIKSGLLRQGLCPSCAGDLRPVQPEPDGATVCPTCRAAWMQVRRLVYVEEVEKRADAE